MGVKLVGIFDAAEREFGFMGRMKLAMLTKVASAKAAEEVDSPENVRAFEAALTQLRKTKAA
jgi:hypothetical protein